VQTLKNCGMEEGMVVLDFGCGAPHYSIAASYTVGTIGKVYAADRDKGIIRYVSNQIKEKNIANVIPLTMDERKLSDFPEKVDFIMVYDLYFWGKQSDEDRDRFIKFRELLKKDSILSIAVYSDIALACDPVNGPFTPKGKPSWFKIPYEDALVRYNVFTFIESCGFALKNIVENGGVHFDEIDNKLHKKTFQNIRMKDIERKNIYNYTKD